MDCEIEKNKISKKSSYGKAFKAAFPYTIPVMTGYLFIGMAFGVMIQEKGYNFLWAILMSVLCYAGSGQYLAVNFFAPGVSLLQVIFMEFMLNIRHIFYGLSLLERFAKMGKKRLYMIFSLTDETYSLFFVTKVPKDVEEGQFLFAIALLDQLYWIIGSAIGALLGSVLPIDTTGIDFAMTALFVVIFSLTDETYSLFFVTKVPKDVEEGQFLFAIALLDQLYWIIGSAIGALLGSVLPIDTTGIDFAMTALFVVIMVEQWMESKNRPSVLIGLGCGLVCLLIFGADNFILPTMICIMLILLPCRKFLDKETEQKKEVEHHAG